MNDKLKASADRALELLETKTTHQLAVDLVSMQDLLLDLRKGAEIHLHNCTVCKNDEGVANWTGKLKRIDALLAGKILTAGVDVADGRFEIQIAEWSALSETIRTAPERIWLQVGDQAHYHSEPFPPGTGEVTWCADSVVGCEVPYVRADLAGQVPAQTIFMNGCSVGKTTFLAAVTEGWQPINTAPQDGTRILLFYPSGTAFPTEQVVGGGWDGNRYAQKPRPYWSNDKENIWGVKRCRDCPPTHWMPLPAEPHPQGGE